MAGFMISGFLAGAYLGDMGSIPVYAKAKHKKKAPASDAVATQSATKAAPVAKPISTSNEVKPSKLSYTIDDFEDGNYTKNPEWWKFDRLFMSVVKNSPEEKLKYPFLGNFSLLLEGSTTNWYIGGCGLYIGKDATSYDALQLVVYGNGPNSGLLKIELYDDDNGNWDVDVDKAKNGHNPTADDKFTYTLDVNWAGWKVVTIPFYDFEDENPGIGDDKWNPDQKNGSGGLLQMQMIALSAGKPVGKIDVKIDSIKLIKR